MNSRKLLAGTVLLMAITKGLEPTMLTGIKSLLGSKLVLLMAGKIASTGMAAISKVYPSAGDLETKSAAMAPLAPALFSTITDVSRA